MAIERTLSIIKPDAVGKNIIGKIISRFEDNQLNMVAGKLVHLSDEMASGLNGGSQIAYIIIVSTIVGFFISGLMGGL